MQKKLTLLLPFLIAVLVFGVWLQRSGKNQAEPLQGQDQIYASPTLSPEMDQETIISLEALTDGQTAFELLGSQATVAFKQYDFGVFIESINGLAGDEKHFWALYIDDEQSQVGADQLVLQKGDRIEFRYEEISTEIFETTGD
jgi:hypothetical protein